MGKLQKMMCLKKIFLADARRVGEDPHTPRRGGPLRPLREKLVCHSRAKMTGIKNQFPKAFNRTTILLFFLRLSQKMSATLRFHQNYREESMQNMLKHVKKLEKSKFFYIQRWPAIIAPDVQGGGPQAPERSFRGKKLDRQLFFQVLRFNF